MFRLLLKVGVNPLTAAAVLTGGHLRRSGERDEASQGETGCRPASGGSRWFTTSVYSPTGARIFHEVGYAPSTHWDLWPIKATRTGNYKVRYEVRRHDGHDAYAWYTVKPDR